MLKSIEERMEDQLLEKERERFTDESFPANWASKVNNHYDESGQYTSEDFEIQANELYLRKLKAEFENRELKTWLRALILQTPNDQELGAAIREWYHDTEGKFI